MGNVAAKRWSGPLFLSLFGLALLLLGRMVLPLLMPVLLGGFLAVLLLPMHDFLVRHLGGHARWAAAVSTVAVFGLFLVPFGLAFYAMARESVALVGMAQAALAGRSTADLAAALPEGVLRWLPIGMRGDVVGSALAALPPTAAILPQAVSAGAELGVDLLLLTVCTYYFFLDGRRIFRESARLLPLDTRYSEAFAREFREVAHALVYGNALTGLLQGTVGWAGLWLAGVSRPHVWALGMVFASFIPVGGTALVWGPLGLVLALTGHMREGLFLLGWGVLVVSMVDNVARPLLCGARLSVHPLLVVLSIFGGLAVFGLTGLLVGPLVAALAMTMVRIYRRDFLGLRSESSGPASAAEPMPIASLSVSMDGAAPPK